MARTLVALLPLVIAPGLPAAPATYAPEVSIPFGTRPPRQAADDRGRRHLGRL
jgi:hypothetical protein